MKNTLALYVGFAEEQPLSWLWFTHATKTFESDDELLADFGRCLLAWAKALYAEAEDPRRAMEDLLRNVQRMEFHEFQRLWPENDQSMGESLPEAMEDWTLIVSPEMMLDALRDSRTIVVLGARTEYDDPIHHLFARMGDLLPPA